LVVTELPAGVHLDEFDQDHRIWLGTIASHLGTDTRNSGPVGEATLHAGTTGRVLAEPASESRGRLSLSRQRASIIWRSTNLIALTSPGGSRVEWRRRRRSRVMDLSWSHMANVGRSSAVT